MHLINIATRCADVRAFRDLFSRYIDPDDHALFVSAGVPPAVGTKLPFQIRLRDGSLILRGESEVVRSFGTEGDRGPWARSGYCLKLSGLESESAELYQELVEAASSVSEQARATVPPVAPEASPELGELDVAPTPPAKMDPENSSELIMNALAGAVLEPPSTAEPGHLLVTPDTSGKRDPVWGTVPPPPTTPAWLLAWLDGGRRWVGSLKRSRRAQIQAGAVAGVLLLIFLAVWTLGGDEETGSLTPAIDTVAAAGMAPSPAEQARRGALTSVPAAASRPRSPAEPVTSETTIEKTERSQSTVRSGNKVRTVKRSKKVSIRKKRSTTHAWR